jgi:hypothetical protein
MTKPASTMEKPTLTARAFARMALGSFSDELQPIRRPLPTFSTDSDSDVSRLFFFMPCIPDVCLVKRLQKAKCGLFSAGVLAFYIFFGRREEQQTVKARKVPSLLAIFVLPVIRLDG